MRHGGFELYQKQPIILDFMGFIFSRGHFVDTFSLRPTTRCPLLGIYLNISNYTTIYFKINLSLLYLCSNQSSIF